MDNQRKGYIRSVMNRAVSLYLLICMRIELMSTTNTTQKSQRIVSKCHSLSIVVLDSLCCPLDLFDFSLDVYFSRDKLNNFHRKGRMCQFRALIRKSVHAAKFQDEGGSSNEKNSPTNVLLSAFLPVVSQYWRSRKLG